MKKLLDLTGKQVGRLKVLYRLDKKYRNKEYLWMCQCSCGTLKVYQSYRLNKERVFSCGCLTIDRIKEVNCGRKPERSLPEGEASFNRIFYQYQKSAMKRGYEFNLSKEQVKEIIQKECYYCGEFPQVRETIWSKRFNKMFIGHGMDRKNNNEGYYLDNVVSCCERCNTCKMHYSMDEFFEMCTKIYNRHIKD